MARTKTDPKPTSCLTNWLDIVFDRPERSYNPDVRDFLADLLGYTKSRVVTEDKAISGYPDIKLITTEGVAWVVGDFKKDDTLITDPRKRTGKLWEDKKKYVSGDTQYVLFLTPKFIWVALPNGEPVPKLKEPIDLRSISLADLKDSLGFIAASEATHKRIWEEFRKGALPFCYYNLSDPSHGVRLQSDLKNCFELLEKGAREILASMEVSYKSYQAQIEALDAKSGASGETYRRIRSGLDFRAEKVRRLFEVDLALFEEQYGAKVDDEKKKRDRIRESFIVDSVSALIARVLFLRLVEDLKLTSKRRLSNGGPKKWNDFVDRLAGEAQALVRVASEDVARAYQEPFEPSVFEWIYHANGKVDEPLQRLLLRLNAYDLSGLSEDLLGEIYQQFLPPKKRKQFGEFYTPKSIVNWLLDQTGALIKPGDLLDPSCGSGSFLVQYVHRSFEDSKTRGLDPQTTARAVQERVWGFDINPFASFISHFQILWANLRFCPSPSSPHVRVHNLNSLLVDTATTGLSSGPDDPLEGILDEWTKARDTKTWMYVVGNPPYIRAERAKYAEEVKKTWSVAWGQNGDTGLIFLYRSLSQWLSNQGFLGMVVSGGYASSEAAAKVWTLLRPGKNCSLRKVVWMEFSADLWDAAAIPMLLVIEKVPPKATDKIELFTPKDWTRTHAVPGPVSTVKYFDYFNQKVTPKVGKDTGNYGDQLSPFLCQNDVPLLKRFYPDGTSFITLGSITKWTNGIQRGGVEPTLTKASKDDVQLISGRSIAVCWPGTPLGWIDLGKVQKKSLWGGVYPKDGIIAVAKFGLAPVAALLPPGANSAYMDSATICGEAGRSMKAIAAVLNSSLTRFYWALRLRTTPLAGSTRSQFHPRTMESLPWPKEISVDQISALEALYDSLSLISDEAKNSPDMWLEEQVSAAGSFIQLDDPSIALSFHSWPPDPVRTSSLVVDGHKIRVESGSMFFLEVGTPELATLLSALLRISDAEFITKTDIQTTKVPTSLTALAIEYKSRSSAFLGVESRFLTAIDLLDEKVFEIYAVSSGDRDYIRERLTSFPLNLFKPRMPWQPARERGIKTYTEDRFA